METLSIQHTFVTSGATVKVQKAIVDNVAKLYITLSIPGVQGEIPLETTPAEVRKIQQVLSLGLSAFAITQS
jgi:hypothetical protein